jgi:hypothetical protein
MAAPVGHSSQDWLEYLATNAGATIAVASANFTRPSDTTAYAFGDLIANTTVANTVVPMQFTVARVAAGSGFIRRIRLRKSSITTTLAQFRLHLYTTSPTQTGAGGANTGDNAAWSTDQVATYIGALDVTMDRNFTDGTAGPGYTRQRQRDKLLIGQRAGYLWSARSARCICTR